MRNFIFHSYIIKGDTSNISRSETYENSLTTDKFVLSPPVTGNDYFKRKVYIYVYMYVERNSGIVISLRFINIKNEM